MEAPSPFKPQPVVEAAFPDLYPSLRPQEAKVEANRCLYCFDAPCAAACPTHIDVPAFIKKIASGNLRGSAHTILESNALALSCSRACPVDVLCEGACVMHRYNKQPIEIGLLQRHAMEAFLASGETLPLADELDAAPGRFAMIGAGPASLACAAELARRGHHVEVFDRRALPGGLNTHGIAEYKLGAEDSLREIGLIEQLGVVFHFNQNVDAERLLALEAEYDGIFLGVGLGAMHKLNIPGEDLDGVINALDFIAGYKTGGIDSVPESVVVVGAGNTAIDAAIAARRLGAREVRMVYRRGEAEIPAFRFEYEHARAEGVVFHWHRQPVSILAEGDSVSGLTLVPVLWEDQGMRYIHEQPEVVACQMLIPAIGQSPLAEFLQSVRGIVFENGRVVIDRATGRTNDPLYYAGGDCVNGGREVVDAVADGKRAALAMVAAVKVGSNA
jgi:glutamate synthase (NADPH/NADH) small chain